MSIGFRDKLYWRQVGFGRRWHCFTKAVGGGFVSLCGEFERDRSGGQSIDRPEVSQRCEHCNALEMKRRGWVEPGPTRRMT